ncbi:short chain dehydrogenase [Phlyctema vagabunda]|uniref:Short chain dehydrogenase n=1 Tax=Phlyctema vagabunda TaxID=108571 RepID=A0ABR4PB15_9HELO
MALANDRNNITGIVLQSPPVDTTAPYDLARVAGKTILITGGASGFGEGFFRLWANNGANVIIGDVSDAKGKALVAEVRKQTLNDNHHYLHCDVTNWQSQVDFFRSAVQWSPHGGIDAVVANAGILDSYPTFQTPNGLDADEPPEPNFKTIDVNLIGVMYTAHLACFYLPRNPGSVKASAAGNVSQSPRDRHLLLISSVAGICPIPGQLLYGVSKHGVVGLFRQLRSTSFTSGIRVNLLCPYFIDTPLIHVSGRLILAGAGFGKPEDVVDAGSRFMADSSICGRGLVIGPKVRVDEAGEYVQQPSDEGKEVAVWECYADDFEQVEAFSSRFIRLLNRVEVARGWIGWATDIAVAFTYPVRRWLS